MNHIDVSVITCVRNAPSPWAANSMPPASQPVSNT